MSTPDLGWSEDGWACVIICVTAIVTMTVLYRRSDVAYADLARGGDRLATRAQRPADRPRPEPRAFLVL